MKFAEIFKSLRKDKELTQEQLAEVLGVSPQIVSRWENGISQPSLELLPTIAAYFETSVDTLLGIATPVKKQKVLCFQFRDEKSQNTINEYLEGGWTIKELQTHHLDEGQHPEGVVVIEKIVR